MRTPLELAGSLIFISALLVIAYIDIRHKRIPNVLTFGTFAVLLVITLFIELNSAIWFVSSAAIGFVSIWLVRLISGGKIGMGDVKLSGLISAAIGLTGWFFTLFFASFTGLVGVFILISVGRISRKDPIPFAPFLAAGSICYILVDAAYGLSKWVEL